MAGGAGDSHGGRPDSSAGAGGSDGDGDDNLPAIAACEACNGDWGRHGLSMTEACNCRTTDVGNRCGSDSECEGQCIADETLDIVSSLGPPRLGFRGGRCSTFRTTFGCSLLLRNGEPLPLPVDLDVPLSLSCFD